MTKDWTGNQNSIYKTLGASNHTDKEREHNDYYATEPKALELLLELETFSPYVWECACGQGHLSEVLKSHGHKVKSSDIINRGYPGTEILDFLEVKKQDIKQDFSRDIITNPPYKYAKEFVEHALDKYVSAFPPLYVFNNELYKSLYNSLLPLAYVPSTS